MEPRTAQALFDVNHPATRIVGQVVAGPAPFESCGVDRGPRGLPDGAVRVLEAIAGTCKATLQGEGVR